METALNIVWDAGAAPGDRIAVVGAGVVGALAAWLCARLPGAEVTLVDVNPDRAALAAALGCGFAAPEAAPEDCDLVIHASATGGGPRDGARRRAGLEATVVEASWYGDRPPTVGARRRVPQPAAAAGLEPGRAGADRRGGRAGATGGGSRRRCGCWPTRRSTC